MPDQKPPKPYDTFPLFAHAKGYWCKKIQYKQINFGQWEWPNPKSYEASWKAALERYNQYQEDVARGKLTASIGEEITIEELVNLYLAYQLKRTAGKVKEITAAYFAELREVTTDFRDHVGRKKTIEDLEAFDPEKPELSLVRKWIDQQKNHFGWHAYNKRVSIMSGLFTWAEHPITGVLKRSFRLKVFFAKREDKLRRREKRKKEEFRGKQRFTGDELLGFFTQARNPLRAMIGLMYFAAYGPSDCSDVSQHCINWKPSPALGLPKGWGVINFQRPKTEIDRAAVLPSFVMADLKASIATRAEPIFPELENRVFLTPFGRPWVRDVIRYEQDPNGTPEQSILLDPLARKILDTVHIDSIGQEFRRLRGRLSHCEEHGWIVPATTGSGFRSDVRRVAKAVKRPKALTRCPDCQGVAKPMRKLGSYTFRHTAHTYASGVADDDARALFEGHSIEGVRRTYVEEIDTHKLYLIAQRLLEKSGIPADGGDLLLSTQSASTPAGAQAL